MSIRRPGSPTCCAALPIIPPGGCTSCCPGTGTRRRSGTPSPRKIPRCRSCRLHAVSPRPRPDAYDQIDHDRELTASLRENSHRYSIWESSLNSRRARRPGRAAERPTTVSNQEGRGKMETYRIDRFGSVDGIVLRSSEDPRPGLREILMRVRASSLNYRDLMVLKGGGRGPTKLGVVPLSDGAGEVAAIGDGVTRVKVGDRIAGCFHPRWFGGPIRPEYHTDRLGANLDGMLAEYAVLSEEALVHVPSHLSFEEAATLPCAAVTAWVALTGHRRVTAGDTVLTLGSGGVSVFALQFARRACSAWCSVRRLRDTSPGVL